MSLESAFLNSIFEMKFNLLKDCVGRTSQLDNLEIFHHKWLAILILVGVKSLTYFLKKNTSCNVTTILFLIVPEHWHTFSKITIYDTS